MQGETAASNSRWKQDAYTINQPSELHAQGQDKMDILHCRDYSVQYEEVRLSGMWERKHHTRSIVSEFLWSLSEYRWTEPLHTLKT